MPSSFHKLIFMFIHASESAHSELSYKKILIKKFQKLMEKFTFYLNPVHFFILFFDFKVRLKWGNSKIQKYFSEKKSVFFADLPHNRPFPGLWCKKKIQIDFSQKNDLLENLVFNPVQPQMSFFDRKIFNSSQDFYRSFDQARAKLSFPFFKSKIRPFYKILRQF